MTGQLRIRQSRGQAVGRAPAGAGREEPRAKRARAQAPGFKRRGSPGSLTSRPSLFREKTGVVPGDEEGERYAASEVG